MKPCAFIDSDVILDVLMGREQFMEHSSTILRYCELGYLDGYVSPLILSNLYYILRKQNQHEKVIVILKKLLQIVKVVSISEASVHQALDSEFKDFEDALQLFAAKNHDFISHLVTRNTRDFNDSELAIMTPFEFLAQFNNGFSNQSPRESFE